MKDKREHQRIPVAMKVSYLSRGDLQKDLVTDLSPGGLFIRTSRPLAIGTDVDLEVAIGEEDLPITVRGRVVWLRDKSGPQEGMGIQFTGFLGAALAAMVQEAKKG
jgi:uncharacterized protein (TIGR02266 family)